MANRVRRFLFGPPKDIKDPHAFHKLSLVAILAWVGLGADGLSSSAYGPDEAFRSLGERSGVPFCTEHADCTSLSFFLALAMAATVFIISYGYSRIIEQFPSGGGGYVVASRLLHPRVGVMSGSALLVDYVLTITISIASGADAIFSFLPEVAKILGYQLPDSYMAWKMPFAFAGIVLLTIMNIRGVKESVSALVPIFGTFVVTHVILLVVAIGGHLGDAPAISHEVRTQIVHTTTAIGSFRSAQAPRARVFDGWWNLHGDRSGLERRRTDARAARCGRRNEPCGSWRCPLRSPPAASCSRTSSSTQRRRKARR